MLTRGRCSLIALAIVTFIGACLRFNRLSKGAPYHRFHIDEHFVFLGADLLRDSTRNTAESQKFFLYGPLPMHLLACAVLHLRDSHFFTVDISLVFFCDQMSGAAPRRFAAAVIKRIPKG